MAELQNQRISRPGLSGKSEALHIQTLNWEVKIRRRTLQDRREANELGKHA
jgi:hypothetical protein